ncbi:DNA internalization-related competence protein ComEC/Rec2 [Terasakiispira papahanaumokuakeensis]|nr:DNA internalization-related competence protein ComEC/Rec2 [Terasakiispira papahanaumokuakeensis]
MHGKAMIRHWPPLWQVTLGFAAGVGLTLWQPEWPPLETPLCLLGLGLALLLRRYWGISGVFLGAAWGLLNLAWQLSAMPDVSTYRQPVVLTGVVTQRFDGDPAGFVLRVEHCFQSSDVPCSRNGHFLLSGAVRLNWYASITPPREGERWRLSVRLRPLHGAINPGVMENVPRRLVSGERARGYVPRHADAQRLNPASGWRLWRAEALQALHQKGAQWPALRWVSALALGHGEALSDDDWQLLRETGTVHLWVVSGLHLGLLFACVVGLGRGLRWPWWPTLVIGLCVAGSFALLSGWGVAAQRAFWMLCLLALGLSGWRALSPWTGIAVALWGVLLLQPLAMLTAGFWLSFVAVGLLIWTFQGRGRLPLWRQALIAQWVMAWGLLPFIAGYTGHVSWVAPLLNLILVPLMGVILPVVLVALGLWMGVGVEWGLHMVAWGFDALMSGLAIASHEQPDTQLVRLWPLALGLLVLLPPGFALRWLAPCGVVLAFWPDTLGSTKTDHWEVLFFDVGQGTAVGLRQNQEILIYDVGPRYPSGWAPLLRPLPVWQGADALRHLVVSHDDNDHAGALSPVLALMSPGLRLGAAGPNAQGCYPAGVQRWGALTLYWVGGPAAGRVDNASSCTLLVVGPGGSVLLTGDIDQATEQRYLGLWQQWLDGESLTVLLAPHHGSRTSTSAKMLTALRPQYAVHTAGWHNRYGHPHESVVRRLSAHRVQQWQTGLMGAIRVRFSATSASEWQALRHHQQRLWDWGWQRVPVRRR